MKDIRMHPSILSLSCGHDVSFPEFVKFIIFSEKTLRMGDRHFMPMYEHCWPCQIKYDVIGKMETFKNDSIYILQILQKKFNINLTISDFGEENDIKTIKLQSHRIFMNFHIS